VLVCKSVYKRVAHLLLRYAITKNVSASCSVKEEGGACSLCKSLPSEPIACARRNVETEKTAHVTTNRRR